MKLRIQGNRIRVRLTQSEVQRVAAEECVEQITVFSKLAKLSSRVETSPRIGEPIATFENQRITLQLPLNITRQWANSAQVGIEAQQPVGDGTLLYLLIEKDFACLHPRAEEIADAFPNPKSTDNA